MEPIKLHDKRHLDTMPAGALGIVPIKGCEEMASEINYYLTRWRDERESEHKDSLAYIGYKRPSYIVNCDLPRFGTGEGKGVMRVRPRYGPVPDRRCRQLQRDL